jgi:hypothetical protein
MSRSEIFDSPLRQPDPRSCGAAALVVARMLRDPAYAEQARRRFAHECVAMHRRVTSPSDVRGRLQAPWPRFFGTPPWAVARQLAWTSGVRHRVRLVRPEHRVEALSRALAAVAAGFPVALYVGSRRFPRHVVLLVEAGDDTRPTAYEPASGELVRFTPQQFVDGTLDLGGWSRPWFVVSPRKALPSGRHAR